MKYFSAITIGFLVLASFFLVNPKMLLAASPIICAGAGSPVQCSGGSFGGDIEMDVIPYNDQGDPIMGSVSYAWTLVTPALGALTVLTPNSLTLGQPSKAKLTLGYAVSIGTVQVIASYGGDNIAKIFDIVAACNDDPNLYYGIGGVSKTGANSYQYSTAEVLSTCKDEYRLYEGDGSK